MEEENVKLDLSNGVIFTLVMMEYPDLCKRLIETIIGKTIDEIDVLTTEESLKSSTISKDVRLDVLVSANGVEYNIEMQIRNTENIPYRSRFYHAKLDTKNLGKGDPYTKLPESFVIFIGKDELFGDKDDNIPIRTFKMTSVETGEQLNDGIRTIILNAQAWKNSEGDLRDMLELIHKGKTASSLKRPDSFAASLQSAVTEVQEGEMDMAIMTAAYQLKMMEDQLDERFEEGLAEGEEKTLTQLERLYVALDTNMRGDEYLKALQDSEYREKLLKEFGID